MQVHGLWGMLRGGGEGVQCLLFIIAVLWGLIALVVHFILAAVIMRDADTLQNPRPEIPPWVWFFVVMISSLLGVVAYWLMNYSTLSRRQD